jgi:tricorn protease
MRLPILALGAFVAAGCLLAQPLLLQKPSVSRSEIAFSYGGDLWVVSRDGGEARRLTAGIGVETDPRFSPDGSLIAFTGEYDGNHDVYVVPAAGGEPRRLTYHPAPNIVLGWTPDGKRILFRSPRDSYSRFDRLFTVAIEGGGLPDELPLPLAEEGSYSPDALRLAYVPLPHAFDAWKRYRGGRTTPIWIADLADSRILEKVPRENSNDFEPMWVKDRVYFVSDRNGPFALFYYDLKTKKVVQAVPNSGLDIKSASAGPDAIVYEQFGSLHLYDLKSGKEREVKVTISADLPEVRPTFEKVAHNIESGGISPTGARAVFGARGEILTVPAEKGDVRDLTNTPGAAERYPAWSPDGTQIAYFSDESGEYALHIRNQSGMGEVTKIALPPSFYYSPVWSPDSKKIAFTDKGVGLWYLDLEKRTPVKVDADTYKTPGGGLDPTWAPDSRWIAYTKILPNHMRAVFAYSIETGKSTQITDGMSDARFAAFDKNGEHLYFTASTDAGPTTGWLDMSGMDRPVTRSVYVAVLRKDLISPLAPESDEEKGDGAKKNGDEKKPDGAEAKDKEKEKKPEPVRIDFEGISQRILALPIPARNYGGLYAGKTGVLYLVEDPPVQKQGPTEQTIQKFELKTRKTERFLEGVRAFDVSFNGEKALYCKTEQCFIVGAGSEPKPGDGRLKIEQMQVRVDPRAEFKQMYNEVWRVERDFFYDPGLHGVDLKTYKAKYEPYLERLGSRAELNYLFNEMLGELTVGHLYVRGGDGPDVKRVPGGLLGADYKIENGRYRFAKVYDGENWNPQLRAPLTQPGVNVVAGEYLLAVNGRELRASDDIYSFFEETAGKSVVLKVGPEPDGTKSREVTVVPVESEFGLRNLAWIEENRRKVEALSGGRLAYVYLPNTAEAGYTYFNRYYFAQVDKAGAVIDERFNGGGAAADYIIDYMRRPLMNYFMTRDGEPFTTPTGSIFGPKVMIINEYAGSGGDMMPWMFRKAKVGKLVGKRTWGGLVGIFGFPPLMDGGTVTAPNLAFYNTEGHWDVENHGVPPDVEVEFDPQAWRAGHDPQLERAVEIALAELKQNPPPVNKRPAFPDYHEK